MNKMLLLKLSTIFIFSFVSFCVKADNQNDCFELISIDNQEYKTFNCLIQSIEQNQTPDIWFLIANINLSSVSSINTRYPAIDGLVLNGDIAGDSILKFTQYLPWDRALAIKSFTEVLYRIWGIERTYTEIILRNKEKNSITTYFDVLKFIYEKSLTNHEVDIHAIYPILPPSVVEHYNKYEDYVKIIKKIWPEASGKVTLHKIDKKLPQVEALENPKKYNAQNAVISEKADSRNETRKLLILAITLGCALVVGVVIWRLRRKK